MSLPGRGKQRPYEFERPRRPEANALGLLAMTIYDYKAINIKPAAILR